MNTMVGEQKRFYIVGHDIDPDMLRVLTPGDKVLAETNGARLFSTSTISSIATDFPWVVEENSSGRIVLSNPLATDNLVLTYDDIVTCGNKQPAVFLQDNSPYVEKGKEFYAILQMISCGMTEEALELEVDSFDEIEIRDWLDDDRVKVGMLELWCQIIQSFSKTGWHYQSVKRFALRANISISLVKAFQEHDWSTLLSINDDIIVRIGREMHSLPHLMRFAGSMIQHDTTELYLK